MKALDSLPGRRKLPHQIKLGKFSSILDGIPCHDDSFFGKQVRARIPHHANHLLWERDAAIDAVILLPKSARSPRYLVSGFATCDRNNSLAPSKAIRRRGEGRREWRRL